MTLFQILKTKWQKRAKAMEEAERSKRPLDTELPLHLRMNGKVQINVLLPEKAMSAAFPNGEYTIEGFSKTEILGHTCFKVILAAEDGETHSYLWMFHDEKGVSIKWFVKFDEVFPSSADEWKVWTDGEEGLIGLPEFQLKEKAAGVPGDIFQNAWSGDAKDRIEPPVYTEEVQLDKYDASEKENIKHTSMLYSREVADEVHSTVEYLLTEILEGNEGAHVSLFVGVELTSPGELNVLY